MNNTHEIIWANQHLDRLLATVRLNLSGASRECTPRLDPPPDWHQAFARSALLRTDKPKTCTTIQQREIVATGAGAELGFALQQLMLPAEVPAAIRQMVQVAVRYQPASDALRVGGDWYDVAYLGHGRIAVAVGDVVGHGVQAAAVMGQLRSALSALIIADVGPSAAMTALDRVARHIPGAMTSTSVKVVIDLELDLAVYSSAGHLPPLIMRNGGTVEALHHGLGPPLAVTENVARRPMGTATLTAGDTLVLYTDGLIEHRGEALDLGIARLAATLIRHRELDVEALADQLLTELPPQSMRDDIALTILRR